MRKVSAVRLGKETQASGGAKTLKAGCVGMACSLGLLERSGRSMSPPGGPGICPPPLSPTMQVEVPGMAPPEETGRGARKFCTEANSANTASGHLA